MKKMLGKRFMFLVALLVGLCVPAMAQNSYTFNVASVNIEGVPEHMEADDMGIIDNFPKSVNEGGIGESGTKVVGQKIMMRNWNIIGVCENYNFSSALNEVISSDFYCINENKGTLTYRDKKNDTDGLSILVNRGMGGDNANLKSTSTRWSNSNLTHEPDADYWVSDDNAYRGDTWAYRGFRKYEVVLPNVGKVDVYILHMDAGDATGSVSARNAQLEDLADKIITNMNSLKRPAIVMGMTNSLYTRENLKTNFIDKINSKENLIINDAWVELQRGGKYPVYKSEAETPGTFYFDDQNGEVVNKIFYINHASADYTIVANSYFRESEAFGNLKHAPVVTNFTVSQKTGNPTVGGTSVLLKDAEGNTLKNADGTDVSVSNDWVKETQLKAITNSEFSGIVPQNIGNVVLMNVGSGLYLNMGAAYGTQAAEGSEVLPLTMSEVNKVDNNLYTGQISSMCGKMFMDWQNKPFMDGGSATTWMFSKVADNVNQYYIYVSVDGVSLALTSTGEAGNEVLLKPLREENRQKWVLFTETELRNNLKKASLKNPIDVTHLVLPGAEFNNNNGNKDTYSSKDGNNVERHLFSTIWNNDVEPFDYYAESAADPAIAKGMIYKYTVHDAGTSWGRVKEDPNFNAISISKKIVMPAGKYTLSFKGMYRARAYSGSDAGLGNSNQSVDITMSLGTASANVMQCNEIGMYDGIKTSVLAMLRNNDAFKNSCTYNHSSDGELKFSFYKAKFDDGTDSNDDAYKRRFFIAIDDISIKYFGSGNINTVYNLICNYLIETALKVNELNLAGQAAYNVDEVILRLNNNGSGLSNDGQEEIAMIDAAYETALRVHNAKLAEDALNNQTNKGDITSLIVNPSFEDNGGSTDGWSFNTHWGISARADLPTEGQLGNYLLDAAHYYEGAHRNTVPATKQTITGLKNGLYKLQAKVTSFGPGEEGLPQSGPGNFVYLIGNSWHEGVEAKTKDKFEDAELYFLVEDGTATIGVVGGYQGHYYTTGCFYKADDFRLNYICDLPHGRVFLAHREAKAVRNTFDKFALEFAAGENQLDYYLSEYEGVENGGKLTKSNGEAEAEMIYTALTEAAYRQRTIGADMTWCFGDPSFEIGKYTRYWSMASGNTWGDFKAAKQDDEQFAAVGTVGSYLLNVYDWDGTDALTTTIGLDSKIPNGIYRISAMVTSHSGCKVYIEAGGSVSEPVTAADYNGLEAARWMNPISHEFEVTDGTADIKIYATNASGDPYHFFKADDFHLELVLLASNQKPTDKYEDNTTLYLDENSVSTPILPRSGGNFNYTRVKVKREIKKETWSTLVLPFTMNVSDLGEGWIVKELESAKLEDNEIKLVFTSVTDGIIEQGKCYLVRNNDVTVDKEGKYALQELNAAIVADTDGTRSIKIGHGDDDFDKTFNNSTDLEVTYHGTYYSRYVPKNAWFVTGNKFKYATGDATNRIKGFRAYFTAPIDETTGFARGFGFRIDESTGVDATNKDEVTVVGIYNLSGMRLTDMEPGVNILQMSDGTSVKVIIK